MRCGVARSPATPSMRTGGGSGWTAARTRPGSCSVTRDGAWGSPAVPCASGSPEGAWRRARATTAWCGSWSWVTRSQDRARTVPEIVHLLSTLAEVRIENARLVELRAVLGREQARGDRLEVALVEARKGWLERLIEAVRRR
jgi:hypothetical protein